MSKKVLAAVLATAFFFLSACSDDDSISSSDFHGADYLFTSQSELNENTRDEEHENSTAYFKPEEVFLVCEYSDKYEEWVWAATDSNGKKSSSSTKGQKSSSSKKTEPSDKSSSSSAKSSSSPSSEKTVRDTTSAQGLTLILCRNWIPHLLTSYPPAL